MLGGDVEHTGVYGSGESSQLDELVWKFNTGTAVCSSPAISDGVVYFGVDDGHPYALK
jgi:outer membrane protein assembly factor BamB